MTVLVLCNVGNRDVALEGESKFPAPARTAGARLLAEYDRVAPRLKFPIIEPCLRYVIGRHPGGVHHLMLFGTDQPDPEYRDRDTLHFAALAARRLPEKLAPALGEAEWQPITGINPALYDETFDAFDELLARVPAEGVDVCYVAMAGGIPACNTALLLQAVRRFGGRLRVVYQPPDGEPQELRAGEQVIGAFREAAAVEHLERCDFANAVPRLERLGAHPSLTGLARYAAERLAFDFRSAQDTLLGVQRAGGHPVRSFLRARLLSDLDTLLGDFSGPRRLRALLRELYWNAVITYRHRRYADFLGRVYRFQEAVLRYLVEEILGLPTDLAPEVREETKRRWKEGIGGNEALVSYLAGQEVDGKELDWRRIGRPTYQALLAFATGEPPERGVDAEGRPVLSASDRKRYSALLKRVNAFDGLVELRHRTIIGHDFEGVSQELLEGRYKGSMKQAGQRLGAVEGLREIVQMLEIDVRDDPYALIATFVIEQL